MQTELNLPPSTAAPGGPLADLLAMLQSGGPVVALLIAMSVAATAIVLAKAWQLRGIRSADAGLTGEALSLWQAGRTGEAVTRLEGSTGPLATQISAAMRGIRQGMDPEMVRTETMRFAADTLEACRTGLRPLEVIASLAPLLGLFGTVLGMIEAFRQLEAAGNQVNPAILSGGIWEALLTTAVGLAVAIPAVVALNWLERRIERLAHTADSAIARLFTQNLPPAQHAEASHVGDFHPAAVAQGGD